MTMTRREMLGVLGVLGAGAVASLSPRFAWAAGGGYPWPLGVQLWSVKAEMDQDFDGTLAQLAKLGYREIESAGLHGRTPQAFREAVVRAGLKPVSAHFSMGDLFGDAAARIADARAMGVQWIVASSPRPDKPLGEGDWIPAIRDAMTLDAWKKNAAELNRIGAMAKAAGLKLGYHNHPIEFAEYDGQRGYDVILEHTDPALVKLELDVAWAVAGGVDPIALLKKHADRIRLLHIKGLKAQPAPGTYGNDFASGVIGTGDVIDWPPIFAAARKAGVVHAFVEQEPPHIQPIMKSLAACRDYLQSL